MALFKFRQGEDSSQAAPAQSVEVLRQRAKHRLIGAVVLVTLGVVGFPLLVDKQPRPMSVDLPIEIPDKNKTKPLSLPAATPSAVTPAPAADTATVKPATLPSPPASSVVPPAASLSSQEAIEPKTAKAEPKTEPKIESKADSKPVTKPATDKPNTDSGSRALALLEGKEPAKSEAKTDTKAESRLVIQVGAYEDAKKVSEVRAKLERAGLKTYTQVVDTKDGKRTRVRLGPFATKAEADTAVDKIKKLDLPASVLTL